MGRPSCGQVPAWMQPSQDLLKALDCGFAVLCVHFQHRLWQESAQLPRPALQQAVLKASSASSVGTQAAAQQKAQGLTHGGEAGLVEGQAHDGDVGRHCRQAARQPGS